MNTTPEQSVPPLLPENKPPLLAKQKEISGMVKKLFTIISLCITGFLVLVVGLVILGHVAHRLRFANQADKIQIITSLSALKYPADIESAKKLCTDKGAAVLQDMVSSVGFLPASFDVADVKTSGQVCDIGMNSNLADGESKIYVRLINQDGWKFHDVYLATKNGRKFGIWWSFAQQHPFIASAQMAQIYAPEIRSGVNSFENVVRKFKEIENLFGDNSSTGNTLNVEPNNNAEQQDNAQHFQQDVGSGDNANQ